MKFKKVGKIQEPISVIGMGCWELSGSGFWDGSEDSGSKDTVHFALDHGVNLLDVAPVYGHGRAETLLGKAIKGYDRTKFIIASKCGLRWDNSGKEYNDLSKKSILEEIDHSLKRLQTEYIDIYQLHWPDPKTPIEETIETIQMIQQSGKIRYFGVTNFSVKSVEHIMKYISVDSQQGLYNMLERNTTAYHNIPLEYKTEKETLPFCLKHGQAFFPYSPMFQGLLSGTFLADPRDNFSEYDVRRCNPKLNGKLYTTYYRAMLELKTLAESYGHPLNELALNWLIDNPAVTSVIGGALSPAQVSSNLKALEWEITPEMKEKISTVLAPFENM